MHLCAELTVAFWTLEPFGEIGANFSLQLSSQTRFDKINTKKVIAENQCEKHKKSSLVNYALISNAVEKIHILHCVVNCPQKKISNITFNQATCSDIF